MNFRASTSVLGLAAAISIGLATTAAAAVPIIGECTDCLAPQLSATGDYLGRGSLVRNDFNPSFQPIVGPHPDCITGCGAIPEPMSWVLMFLGFGLAGAHLRAKRRLSVA
jgi:hypothetical protein